jgi:hypothetical protein
MGNSCSLKGKMICKTRAGHRILLSTVRRFLQQAGQQARNFSLTLLLLLLNVSFHGYLSTTTKVQLQSSSRATHRETSHIRSRIIQRQPAWSWVCETATTAGVLLQVTKDLSSQIRKLHRACGGSQIQPGT